MLEYIVLQRIMIDSQREYQSFGPLSWEDAQEMVERVKQSPITLAAVIVPLDPPESFLLPGEQSPEPTIVVESDYDGYFHNYVVRMLDDKVGKFKHHTIVISAGPYRDYFVSYRSKDGTIYLDFYAASRVGFGAIDDAARRSLIELL